MNKFIFDVDGTLTPSRQEINNEFREWFIDFCDSNDVYLVTGSDYPKTLEQVGVEICMSVKRIYNCSGNDVWEQGKNIRSNNWILPEDAHEWLSVILTQSQFPLRTGLHFEHRSGMVNFSIVGRNATKEQRAQYVEWDTSQNERNEIAKEFNFIFTDLEARPGGETGIDIAPKGADKSQILVDFDKEDYIAFFGDRMDEDGNDYPLASALFKDYEGANHHVESWEQTWHILKDYYT